MLAVQMTPNVSRTLNARKHHVSRKSFVPHVSARNIPFLCVALVLCEHLFQFPTLQTRLTCCAKFAKLSHRALKLCTIILPLFICTMTLGVAKDEVRDLIKINVKGSSCEGMYYEEPNPGGPTLRPNAKPDFV